MKKKPDISFIIPHWNHRELLHECLSSIEDSKDLGKKEIIVVDNASTDDSADFVATHHKEVVWVQNKRNEGYAKAVNRGTVRAGAPFLFLLNNDVRLYEDTAAVLADFLEATPDAGAVAPLLYYPDGNLQVSCRRFPFFTSLVLEKLGRQAMGPFKRWKLTPEEHLQGGQVSQPMASALLVARQCWQRVGMMDERFPIFFNDVDWCYRLYRQTEYGIYLCTKAKAVHHEGASVNRLGHRKKVEFYKGLAGFYGKHFLR